MIDNLVKNFDKETCLEHQEQYQTELTLTSRRLARLRIKQKLNPNFEAYDRWAEEMVDLPTRIQEQEAIGNEITGYLELIEERLSILELKNENPNCKIIKSGIAQLSLLD